MLPITIKLDVQESVQEYPIEVEQIDRMIGLAVEEEINVTVTGIPEYEGEYTVIPDTTNQVLPTKDLRMKDDLTVTSVPYFEMSNEKGITVYIASNV